MWLNAYKMRHSAERHLQWNVDGSEGAWEKFWWGGFVSNRWDDSGQAHVDIRQKIRSSPMGPWRNIDIINVSMKKRQ